MAPQNAILCGSYFMFNVIGFPISLIYQDVFFMSCDFSTSLHFVKISTGAAGLFKQQVLFSPYQSDENLPQK